MTTSPSRDSLSVPGVTVDFPTQEGTTMTATTTNPHPVDSETRACCGGIGRHVPDCPEMAAVPMPAGASRVFNWESAEVTGRQLPSRIFDGTVRRVERLRGDPIEVRIEGTQLANGFPERLVRCQIREGDDVLTTAQARKLAEALADAAAEVDQMNEFDSAIVAFSEAADVIDGWVKS
ncbi:hypothetical protein [Mycobacterium sp. HUMS_1102779]|uniref:hypothetical protein n=1 Tax=Mycobacterium sp. HUMS_1102779 TaxID=3383487 RepID=UPI0038998B06